jgi:hypothetical protein
MCCEVTREWLTAMDFSELGGADVLTGPRWLRQRFNWGCSTFPIYWCEAIKRDTLDCGALAALSHEVFLSRGVKSLRVQLVQKFSKNATGQWTSNWHDGNTPLEWVHNDLIYHEGCAVVLPENQIKIWDSSAGWWIDCRNAALGIIFGASSLYLVLKTGLTVSASIPVAVISITLFRLFSKAPKSRATRRFSKTTSCRQPGGGRINRFRARRDDARDFDSRFRPRFYARDARRRFRRSFGNFDDDSAAPRFDRDQHGF